MSRESEITFELRQFAVKNTTHGCGFFATPEEALKQIERCAEIPQNLLYFPKGKGCQICHRSELPDIKAYSTPTCPFGTKDGKIDDTVKVIYLQAE